MLCREPQASTTVETLLFPILRVFFIQRSSCRDSRWAVTGVISRMLQELSAARGSHDAAGVKHRETTV